jgi:hypothetical protein
MNFFRHSQSAVAAALCRRNPEISGPSVSEFGFMGSPSFFNLPHAQKLKRTLRKLLWMVVWSGDWQKAEIQAIKPLA